MDNVAAAPKVLTPAQLARYHGDGCLFPVPALSADEAAGYLQQVEAFEARQGGASRQWPRALSHKPHVIHLA